MEDWSYSNLIPSDQELDLGEAIQSERMPESSENNRSTNSENNRSRNFCFTINNPCANIARSVSSAHSTETSEAFLVAQSPFINCTASSLTIKLCVWQLEEGSNSTPHIQGYIEMAASQRYSTMKQLFSGTAHIEKRKGTRHDNILYCTKAERLQGPWHYALKEEDKDLDALILRAQKTKLTKADKKAINMMKECLHKNDDELLETYGQTYLRFVKQVEHYRLRHTKPRDWEMNVIVLQGPTGCGKSKWAKENFPGAYYKMDDKWWDGYNLHESVILDDFYGGWIKLAEFLKLLDRYEYHIQVKGGVKPFVAKNIIITTNTYPDRWYKFQFDRIERRISRWLVFNSTLQSFSEFSSYNEAKKLMKEYHYIV